MVKWSAVVTAGATKEFIDDVRYLTNISKGRMGAAIARALLSRGYKVNFLCSPEAAKLCAEGVVNPEMLRIHEFISADRLSILLWSGRAEPPKIVFHSAAVSDWYPVRREQGKMSSESQHMELHLRRTPKLIADLRAIYGIGSFLVGFKLLSGSTRNELIAAAAAQNERHHLNLTVANNLRDITQNCHPVILVTPEGGAINLEGTKETVAAHLVDFVRRRAETAWFATDQKPGGVASFFKKERYAKVLSFAQRSGLLFNISGNLSMRLCEFIVVTPRGADKSTVSVDDVSVAQVFPEREMVRCWGPKSSIDTGMQEMIYRHAPRAEFLLHFHNEWGRFSRQTRFPYPCGTMEEGNEIVAALGDGAFDDAFAVGLLHHGALLGLTREGAERLEAEYDACAEEYRGHLEEVGMADAAEGGLLRPIFSDASIVGVACETSGGVSVFLSERARGKGVGKDVVRQIIARQMPVRTIDACGVIEFYKKFGFTKKQDRGSNMWTLYHPPISGSEELFSRIDEWKIA